MNYRNIAIFYSFVIPFVCYSADNIHLNSGQTLECNILSIGTTTVTAEILSSGIERTFYKTEIKVIIYDDGTAEVFSSVEPEPQVKLDQPSSGWDGERKGFILGIGAGIGTINFDQKLSSYNSSASNSDSDRPFVTNFNIGYAFTNQVLIHWSRKVSWFSMVNANDNDVIIAAGTGNIALSYYLKPKAPCWILSGGLGASTWDAPIEDSGDPSTGAGLFVGGGYEYKKHLNVEIGLYLGDTSLNESGYKFTTTFTTIYVTMNFLAY